MTQKNEDFYKLLGLSKGASDTDIKKAYRKMAMKYHPDRNPGDKSAEEKFKDIQRAYAILSDPKKRQAYDQFGQAGIDPSMYAGTGGGQAGFGDFFEDLFDNIFTGGRASGQHHRQGGADLQYNVTITLEEAALGKQIEMQLPKMVLCKGCHGSGAKAGSKPVTCETCTGSGQVRIQQGFFSIQQTCPTCRGEGRVVTDPCTQCSGQGRVKETKTLTVKIPAGVDQGDRIRLQGEGEAGLHGGPAGDLYVSVTIKPHAIFERHGSDLSCEVPIDLPTAALGGAIEVPTLEGRVTLKIPAETQSGKTMRLRGKGIKSLRGYSTGDLMCKMIVETPINLTKAQKELLITLKDSLGENQKTHFPRIHNWLENVKKFLGV